MRTFEAFSKLDLKDRKVLLYGSTGWIGGILTGLLEEKGVPVRKGRARLEDRRKLREEVELYQPDLVLCAAGVTGRPNVDWCEDNQAETIRTNVVGTLNLADVCQSRGVHCTIFATGCIYEYDEDHPIGSGIGFTEDDEPNFDGSFYSRSKAVVEKLLRSYTGVLILRVRMPISDDSAERCFISKIRRYERIVNIPNSVTVLHELLPASLILATSGKTGVYNFTNPGVISHNECMELYRSIVDPSASWTNFTVEEQDKILKAGRSNNELCTKKLEENLPGIELLSAEDAVREALRNSVTQAASPGSEGYCPENVLLTGGAGFIGSHVVDNLLRDFPAVRITVLDKLDYCASLKNVPEGVRFVKGDVSSTDIVRHLFETERFDTVLHFAAQTHVDNSFGNSLLFTQANVVGTHNLLECALGSACVKRFIHVSTDEVYGEAQDDEDFSESSLLLPTNPYSATKASAEMLVRAYFKSFGIPAIVTRGNNAYGPRQYPEKVVPRFICQGLRGLPMTVHGGGKTRRSFLYVEDVAEAFSVVLRHGVPGQTYNIGTKTERSVLEVAESVSNELGVERNLVFQKDRPFNDRRYCVTGDALEALGWRPTVGWGEGIARTVAWYRENADKHWAKENE